MDIYAEKFGFVSIAFALMTFLATPAFGLDGYSDREGFFGGAKLGGGLGLVKVDGNSASSGFSGERKPGGDLGLEFGAGINKNLAFSVEPGLWFGSVSRNNQSLSQQHYRFLGNANLFVFKGFHFSGGVGFSYGSYEVLQRNAKASQSETGFVFQGGIGYEAFLNGTQAFGLFADYTRHMYSDSTFDTITGGFSFRWY